MADRQEQKFIVSGTDRALLVHRLRAALLTDPHAMADGSYRVRTLYFDDVFDSAASDVLAGAPVRMKYRLRMYNLDPGFLRLEKKLKRWGGGQKPGVLLDPEECRKLLRGDYAFLAEKGDAFSLQCYADARAGKLQPRLIVDYKREAFCDLRGDLRVTVDSDIRVSRNTDAFFSPDLAATPIMENGECVLEVKYSGLLPDYVPQLVGIGSRPHVAMSKYAAGRIME